jgi:DNA-binding NarL/FixJ family response regulator
MDWPIVVDEAARDRLVDKVVSQRAKVQLLHGPSGIGKSTLAAAIAGRLEESGYTILPIVAMPELRDVPLGAMASLLATTGAPVSESTSERLQSLFSLVSPGNARQVLVVDDGPMLDEISASTVYQLVRLHGVRCVMTARTEHPLTGPLLRLQDEGFVDITELEGLGVSVAGTIVQSAFGSPVEPESLRSIVDLAGGNPLFLRELVLTANRNDAVRQGRVGLVVDAAALPQHLRDTIALRFTGLGDGERQLAELIALAEPWPTHLLPSLELLGRLDRAGLVAHASDGEVYLSHPLFAETLIGLMTVEQRDERRIDAARRLLGGVRDDHRFKAVCLLAETSDPPDPEELAWAAAYAHRVDDHSLAIRLSARSVDRALSLGQSPPFDAILVRADALSVSGEYDDAEAAFAEAEKAAETDDARATVATRWGFHLAVRRQRPLEAIRMGTAAIESIGEPSASTFLSANLAKWQLMAGERATVASAPDSTDATTAFNAELYRLFAAVFASDLETARTTIASARPRAEAARSVIRHGVELLDFGEFFVAAFGGRIAEAIEYAEGKRGEFFEESVGMWNYGLALLALHTGRVDDALELAGLAVEQLIWRDFLGALGTAIALRATAAAQLGQRRLAHDILDSIETDALAYLATELQLAEAVAWGLVHDGDEAGAVDTIVAAVNRGIDSRYYAFAGLTASVAVRIGHPEPILEQLRTIEAETTGELIVVLLAHAEALAARDAPALVAAASRLADVGLLAGAVDAARQAAAIARESGQDRAARRASLLANGWDEGLSGMRHNVQGDPSVTLSRREWTVATAAAGRERNREIADRLGLSERTVENHLTNIYRKLGVAGRDELRRELDGLTR